MWLHNLLTLCIIRCQSLVPDNGVKITCTLVYLYYTYITETGIDQPLKNVINWNSTHPVIS